MTTTDELSTARAEIEALRKQLAKTDVAYCDATAEIEALRKRVGELEANNKASGAICDLALANTDLWKARTEQT